MLTDQKAPSLRDYIKSALFIVACILVIALLVTYFVFGIVAADIAFKSDGYHTADGTSIDSLADKYREKLKGIAGAGIVLCVVGLLSIPYGRYSSVGSEKWKDGLWLMQGIAIIASIVIMIITAIITYNYNHHNGDYVLKTFYDPADGRYSSFVPTVMYLLYFSCGHLGIVLGCVVVYMFQDVLCRCFN